MIDLRNSIDAQSSAWDLPESLNNDMRNTTITEKQQMIFGKPDQIRELLAEATGEEPITKNAVTNTPPIANPALTKSAEIINNEQSVEEKLRNIFHLPQKEVLRGGNFYK